MSQDGRPRIKFDLSAGDVISAICSVKPDDWATLFEIFRQQQYNKLRSATTEAARAEIQASVKALDMVESKFKDIRSTKEISA